MIKTSPQRPKRRMLGKKLKGDGRLSRYLTEGRKKAKERT